MEELQTTEILDREILEDARKKAFRILKTAEDTIQAKTAEWEKNLMATLGELEKKYERQGKIAVDGIMIPLQTDKRRVKARKIEDLLHNATETWYAGLSRERILDLLKKELTQRIADSGIQANPHELRVQFYKIEKAEAQTLMQAILPGMPCTVEPIHSVSAYPEIILETKEARVYASIGKTVDYYLSVQRAELIEALLGRAALVDRTDPADAAPHNGGEIPEEAAR